MYKNFARFRLECLIFSYQKGFQFLDVQNICTLGDEEKLVVKSENITEISAKK